MVENDVAIHGHFTIKVKVGNAEIEVTAPEKDFVRNESNRLIEHFALTSTSFCPIDQKVNLKREEPHAENTEYKQENHQKLSEFLKHCIGLQTNLDKILVLGYWCEMKLEQLHFTVEDIQAQYKEIREVPPTNIKRDLKILRSKGFLMPPEKSDNGSQTYTLSKSGISEVESKIPH